MALSLGAAAIVLVPYATVTLHHRQALVAQGVGVLFVVLTMLVTGALRGGPWNVRLDRIKLPLFGLGLWVAAALLGSASGVLHGNDPTLLAGQLLSLGLLPFGALAGAALSSAGVWRWFRWGLVGATAAAALVHLGFWAWSLTSGAVFGRLLFHNNVSPIGVSLLSLLAALSLAVGGPRRQRLAGALCAAAIGLFILGSAVRSLWLVSVLAVAVFGLVTAVRGGFPAKLLLGVAAGILGCLLLLSGLIAAWLRPVRPNLLPDNGVSPTRGGVSPAVAVVPAPLEQGGFAFVWERSFPRSVPLARVGIGEGGVYRLRAWFRGRGGGSSRVALHCKEPWAGYCGSGFVRCRPTEAWRLGESIFLLPAGSTVCHIAFEVDDDASGVWMARPVSLERLGGPSFVPLLALQLHAIWTRTGGVLADMRSGAGIQDGTIAGRLAESAAVMEAFRDSGVKGKLLGRGLGATFRFTTSVLDARDRWQTIESPNYIHNFFLFLLFKLGALGAAAVVVALAAWIGWTAKSAGKLLPRAEGVFLAAAAVAWAAYALWSVACPEILDFRVAPLWGLLLTASADASLGSGR